MIVANYDGTVPAAAQADFNNVIALYESTFTNPVTVNIDVTFGSIGLASNSTYSTVLSYTAWRAALVADAAANPGNSYLTAGVASLPLTDPLGNGNVDLTLPNARALGLNANPPPGQPDSTMTFSDADLFNYTNSPVAGLYNFTNVAEHELDEVLGIGSALTGQSSLPTTFYAEDYFRYGTSGRLVTTSTTAAVYFSYNGGATFVAQFNQDAVGDRNDWIYGSPADGGCPPAAPGPYVQDAYACSGTVVSSPTPEFIVENTLGWDSAPEPATVGLVVAGLAAIALRRRRAGQLNGTDSASDLRDSAVRRSL